MDVVNRSQDLSSISFITGSMAGRTFPISKSIITIGREPKNDIVLSDQTVSREHARLVNNNGQWSIEKLAPTNTITVNKREVQSSPIHDRDEISLGGVITFLFHAASSSDMHGAVAAPPS
ncbi:MAG: FHA domain-containing protein, partial [Ktedonobacteraceae bacterium]